MSETVKSILTTGLHSKRRELAFAELWEESFDYSEDPVRLLLGDDYCLRSAEVAAIIIQWLGSNAGMSFLVEVARKSAEVRVFLEEGFKRKGSKNE